MVPKLWKATLMLAATRWLILTLRDLGVKMSCHLQIILMSLLFFWHTIQVRIRKDVLYGDVNPPGRLPYPMHMMGRDYNAPIVTNNQTTGVNDWQSWFNERLENDYRLTRTRLHNVIVYSVPAFFKGLVTRSDWVFFPTFFTVCSAILG
jgi:hypothetical protein